MVIVHYIYYGGACNKLVKLSRIGVETRFNALQRLVSKL